MKRALPYALSVAAWIISVLADIGARSLGVPWWLIVAAWIVIGYPILIGDRPRVEPQPKPAWFDAHCANPIEHDPHIVHESRSVGLRTLLRRADGVDPCLT